MKTKSPHGISRRDVLHAGVMGGTGLSLAGFLRLAEASTKRPATADSVLFINLAGGPAHLDTLDMKPEGPAETKGEFQPISSQLAGLQVCEHLPQFAKIADQFALIRGISHTSGSHPLGQSYISTGNRPVPSLVYPSFGSLVSKELTGFDDLPPYVAIPKTEWTAGYMGDAYAPLKTGDVPKPGKPFQVRGITLAEGLSVAKVNRRQELLNQIDTAFRQTDTNSQLLEALDKFGRRAHNMITSERSRKAFDVSLESPSIAKLFSDDEFSQSLLLGGRLIEFGVRFVTVTYDGWDTHLDNFKGHKRLLGPLDAGLPALMEMLNTKGLLERMLVVVMGEFGRTPKINQNVGRDHYPRVNWCLMAGGGVKTAQIIGGTDDKGEAPAEGVDIQPDDLAASIYHALGIDIHQEYYTKTGRPVMIVPHGEIVEGLFA